MAGELQDKNVRLRNKITRLLENHPELEAAVNETAAKQPASGSPEQVQANLQEQARAIIEAKPELESHFED
jgi:hypothetical protein